MKKTVKKLLAILLAATFCLGSVFSALPVFAAGEPGHVKIIKFPSADEPNKEYWGAAQMSFANGWQHFATQTTTLRNTVEKNQIGYCIKPGASQHSSDEFTQEDEYYWDNYIPQNGGLLSADEVKEMIGRLMYHGFQGKVHTNWTTANGGENIAYAWATQILIWEVIVGERDSDFNHVGNVASHNTVPPEWTKAAAMSEADVPTLLESKSAGASSIQPVYDMVYKKHPLFSMIDTYYNRIELNMQNHCEKPSFTAKDANDADLYELTKNGDRYETVLTDANGVLGDFEFRCSNADVHFSANENNLTVWSYTPVTDLASVTAERKNTQRCGVLTWASETSQPVTTYVQEVSDPITGYFKIWSKEAPSRIKIIKLSDDGNVAGIDFTITGNGINETVTTGADGTITSGELDPGTYTVTEIVPDGYQPQEPKTVTVNAGETAIVTFNNSLKRGSLKIIKTSEDGRVSGITFVITGSSLNLTAVTNENGEIIVPDLLPGIYTVEEQVSDEYEPQPAQTVTVEYDKTATVTFNNVLRRGSLKIVKTAEDGKIEGITFTIKGENFNQTAATDENGVILLENLLPGIYTVEEQTSDEYEPQPAQTVTVEYDKTATVTFNNVLRRGALKIIKTSENGIIAGISFTIKGEHFNQTVVTDENGVILLENLLPGIYTVEEQTSDEYELQPAQTVTVEYDKIVTVTFNNILKKGSLKVIKSSEDNFIEGLKFRLFGISLSGLAIDMYAVTNADGEAVFENIPISGDTPYTVEEVDTPLRYVVPNSQEVIIVWNETVSVNFENSLKKFTVSVVKTDAETGTAQGGATLSGAVYGIYKDNQLIDEYTTDENGSFVTTEYVCGNDWTIREVKPSVGYTLDETVYVVGAEPGNFVIEHNALSLDVTERVIKAQISITKLADDDCDTQVDVPEAGAEFEIFLKSAGSYEAAAESERDIIACNENGYGITKALPYGLYTVHQTKGWEGYEFVEDFDAMLETDGEIYRIVISNHIYRYLLRVVKTDTETGAVIPVAGAGFRIFDPNGEAVTMLVNYPSPHIVDTFYTDETGSFLTPGTLKYGRGYSLAEVQAPEGYVLDPTPIFFDVTLETVVNEDGEQIITVTISDMPQKGVIKIKKRGEVFAAVSFDEETGTYTPVYSERGLLGAVFEIYAAEDITTPDGTARTEKGTLVDTVTTDENGIAQSRELYLGKYEVKELNAPYGLILHSEIYPTELIYAGQEIAVTAAEITVFNERQRVEISLSKALESDALFGIQGEFSSVRFGLFAAEEIAAADGDVIPADGLIETVTVDENGNAVFNADIPFGHYYVKEISTDEGYILNGEKYPAAFEYAGQELAAVEIVLNNGEPVVNELIYGRVKGYKVDSETGEPIKGALFGLFKADETEFNETNAILNAESGDDGIFAFENLPYGSYIVRELRPAEGYHENGTSYTVTVSENDEVIEITVENERIRQISTNAAVDGRKEVKAEGIVTVEDTVTYTGLIPGVEYTLYGALMNRADGSAFQINGEAVTAEIKFIPESGSGAVTVKFSFDCAGVTSDTVLVVFERLYRGETEIAVHTDINDEAQTVRLMLLPGIPQTGDNSNLGIWIGLGCVALGGAIAAVIMYFKRKKNDSEE